MNCQNNGDIHFNKILQNINLNDPVSRKMLFYKVCIFVRLILLLILILNYKKWYTPYILIIIAGFSIFNLISGLFDKNNTCYWWSKKFQILMSILLFIVCFIIIIFKKDLNILLPIIFGLSLFGGIYQSLFVTFF